MPEDIKPPPYPQDLPSWHELAVEDFQKPWLHYEPFFRSRGYILQSSPDFDSEATKDRFPTKPARDPFHPREDEDFVHRIDWDTHRAFFNLPSPQMVSVAPVLPSCCAAYERTHAASEGQRCP